MRNITILAATLAAKMVMLRRVRASLRPTTTAATPMTNSANTAARSKTTTRRCGSTRAMPKPTRTGAFLMKT